MDKKKLINFLLGMIFLLVFMSNVNAISKTINVNVIETENIRIYYVPVDDITIVEFNRAIINLTNFFNNTYPVADNGLIIGKDEQNINVEKQGTLNKYDRASILKEIQNRASKAGFTYGIGIVRENWFQDRTDQPTYTGVTNDRWAFSVLVQSGQIKTAAHEIGHKNPFNFCEEYDADDWKKQDNDGTLCPNAINATNGRSLNSTCLDNRGCPTNTLSPLYKFGDINETTELRNFMGKTDDPNTVEFPDELLFESWVSKDSYEVLLKELNKTGEEEEDLCLIISATFDIFGVITLDPFYVISKTLCKFFESEEGEYSVRTLDNLGSTLENISFDLEFAEYGDGGNISELNSTFAIFAIPFNGSVSTINFLQNKTLKSQRNVTPNTPNITITSPSEGEMFDDSLNITWNASDLDNDTINYAVLLSSDNGSTFSTLEIDYTNTSLTVNSTNFAESDEYVIKILATDGINTGDDISKAFTLGNLLDITTLQSIYTNENLHVFEFIINNPGDETSNNINWSIDFGDGNTANSSYKFNLTTNEDIFVFVEHNYSDNQPYTVTVDVYAGIISASKSTTVGSSTDLQITSFSELYSMGKEKIWEFVIKNNAETNITGINWNITGTDSPISSIYSFNLTPNETIKVYVHENLTNYQQYTLTAKAFTDTLSGTKTLSTRGKELEVSNIKTLYTDGLTKIFEFLVTNTFTSTINDINWSFYTGESTTSSVYSFNLTIIECRKVDDRTSVLVLKVD